MVPASQKALASAMRRVESLFDPAPWVRMSVSPLGVAGRCRWPGMVVPEPIRLRSAEGLGDALFRAGGSGVAGEIR